jgi:hypothetical protein
MPPKIITKVLNLKTFTIDDDGFAVLKSFDQETRTFTYEIRYTLNTLSAIQKKVKGVCLSVLPRMPEPEPDIFAQPAQQTSPNPSRLVPSAPFVSRIAPIQTKTLSLKAVQSQPVKAAVLVNNILKKPVLLKAIKLSNKKIPVKTVCSDATAKISNSSVSKVSIKPPRKTNFLPRFAPTIANPVRKVVLRQPAQLRLQARPTAVLQSSNLVKPPLTTTLNSPVKLALQSIKNNIDPTQTLSTNFVMSTVTAIKGVSTIPKLPPSASTNPAVTLAKSFLSQASVTTDEDLDNDTYIPVLIKEDQPNISVSRRIEIKEEDIEGDIFYIKMELVNNEDIALEQTLKTVKHGKFVKLLFTPVKAPTVKASQFRKVGQNVLEINQIDPSATSVRIYRKVISSTQQFSLFKYKFAQEIPIRSRDRTVKFVDFTNNTSRIIYRVVSVGPTGIQGSEFSNVIAAPVRFRNTKKNDRHSFSVLLAKASEAGINIEVSSVTPGPIAVKVVRRDLTLHEKDFDTAIPHIAEGSLTFLLADQNNKETFVDRNVKTGHIYEYCAVLIYADGDEEFSSGCDIIEFLPLSVNTVRTVTTTPQVRNTIEGLDIRFKIKSTINQGELDKVKALLEAQGLDGLFQEQLLNEKDKLQQLIAHKVERINLTTGQREQFATITTEEFSDAENQEISGVSPIQSGHRYSYVVSTLLRAPETMFDEFEKKKMDSVLNKEYTFRPAKFLHPFTLKKGDIVTPASLKSNHAKGAFEFGNIGNVHIVTVSLEEILPEISNAKVRKVGDRKNLVSWRIRGDKSVIDHFVIVQRRMRMEDIVGKAHAITDSDIIEFVDLLDEDETGEMTYKVVPVFNSYRRGSAATTNRIVV